MKHLALIALLGMAGCHGAQKSASVSGPSSESSVPDHPVTTGTVRISNGAMIDWRIPKGDFPDGDSMGDAVSKKDCGFITPNLGEGTWNAAVYSDRDKGVRYFHTRDAAIAYVEQWCKP